MIVYIKKIHNGYVIADRPAAIGYGADDAKTLGPTFAHYADADEFARDILGATEIVKN